MNRNILSVFAMLGCFLALLQNGIGQSSKNPVFDCMNEESRAFVERLYADFETDIKTYYQLDRPLEARDYKQYLTELRDMKIPLSFFDDRRRGGKVSALRTSAEFGLIWNRSSVIEQKRDEKFPNNPLKNVEFELEQSNQIPPPPPNGVLGGAKNGNKPDFYQVDEFSIFFECLISTPTNPDIKEMFMALQRIGGLALPILMNSLLEFGNFDDPSIKVYVCIQLYYDFLLGINLLNK